MRSSVAHDDVRNQLLVGRVLLGEWSIEVPSGVRDARTEAFEHVDARRLAGP
jgi:hypothetical protein